MFYINNIILFLIVCVFCGSAIIATFLYKLFTSAEFTKKQYALTAMFAFAIIIMNFVVIWLVGNDVIFLILNPSYMITPVFLSRCAALCFIFSLVLPTILAVKKIGVKGVAEGINSMRKIVNTDIAAVIIIMLAIISIGGGAIYYEFRWQQQRLQQSYELLQESNEQLQESNEQLQESIELLHESAEDLLAYMIISERPDWEYLTDLEKVSHVRDWLITRLPQAPSDITDLPYWQVLVENLYERRGVWCSGSSYLFARINNLLGFESVIVDFGIQKEPGEEPASATHAMTAVRIQHEGEPLLIMLDSYMGLEFFYKDEPADFYELIRAVRDNNTQDYSYNIHFVPGQRFSFGEDPLDGKFVDLETSQQVLTEHMETLIANHGREASIFSYLTLPMRVRRGNIDLINEILDFYETELGVYLR